MACKYQVICYPCRKKLDPPLILLCFYIAIMYCYRWIDSTLTLYEQGLKDHALMFLRFKYYSFMDLDPRVSISIVHVHFLSTLNMV